MRISEYVRQAVVSAEVIPRLNRQDADTIRKLAGEANNINQLAHRANAGGFALVAVELLKLKDRIVEIINHLSDDWKNKKGSGFKGCVNYVLGKEQAVLLHADGVLTESRGDIIRSFCMQTGMNPDLKKPVGHIALSYSAVDALKLTDGKMIQLAQEYMREMKSPIRSISSCATKTGNTHMCISYSTVLTTTARPFRTGTTCTVTNRYARS